MTSFSTHFCGYPISAEFRKEKTEYDANPSKHKKADGYFLRAGMHSEIVTIRALLEQIMKEDAG